ncbi:MAG: NFACT family protein, partial [Clostridia bacterium]|nr:NFACT family protein [Clostridia bacterium]
MKQDAFTIFHIANELNAIIENARVERINQPEKDSVTFRIRSNGSNYVL